MKAHSVIWFLLLLFFSGRILSAQEGAAESSPEYSNKKTHIPNPDIFLFDSVQENRVSLPKTQNYDKLIDSLRTRNYKYKWMRSLSNIVILPSDTTKAIDNLPTERSEVNYIDYEGLIIREIRFIKLDVFGPNILDTSLIGKGKLSQIINNIHVMTSDKVLERHLLFKKGDKIDSREISDNERILRDLSFIEDARIDILIDSIGYFADINVITKDRMSKAFYLDLSSITMGKVELWDRNIFGSGNEFQNNIYWNEQKNGLWGYEAAFSNRNIYGSFIDGKAVFKNVFETQSYGLTFERKFFTPATKWAGGATINHVITVRNIKYLSLFESKIPVKFNYLDLWLGRAISLNKSASLEKNRINLIFASRVYKEHFFERPFVTPDLFYEYHNKTLWLNSIALSSQSYYRSSLIYNFGRTEDIPIGYLANLTFGPEFGEFNNRFYTAFSISKGNYILNAGYLLAQFTEGGFFTRDKIFEQGMYQIKLNFFSNLFIIRRFKNRQFIGLTYTHGIRRFNNEALYLNESNGIRGFPEISAYGNQKLVLNLESVAFTPYYLFGFRFIGFGFLDLARIGSGKNILNEDLFSGIGFGVRIENERLVFPTFELRLGYYPNLNSFSQYDLIRFMGEKQLNPENFYLKNPSLLSFQ